MAPARNPVFTLRLSSTGVTEREEERQVLRGVVNIAIGAVLALLLALASQFVLAPFLGIAGLGTLRIIAGVVFWSVLLLVVIAVLRGPRP